MPRDQGYVLAMNRDERTSRGEASPPGRVDLGETTALYPRDGAGGTWIAANSHGIALALLNWNDVPQLGEAKTRSRGEVIPALARFSSQRELQEVLKQSDFKGMLPFRLVAAFLAEKEIWEWRWDQHEVGGQVYPWVARHWFSSSLSDEQAAGQRGAVCEAAYSEENAGSLEWLRRLHASHTNGPGPFSLCVHRENVRTLSYTELICTPEEVRCNHFAGTPCSMREFEYSVELGRRASPGA